MKLHDISMRPPRFWQAFFYCLVVENLCVTGTAAWLASEMTCLYQSISSAGW